ncbi:MAG TPA: hypothetical protein VEF76_00755 [Patescibacteria group bacterium]|nr:hypothetical protein [Patescibacteria group bacterium]
MASADQLSSNSQKAVLEALPAQHALNAKSARNRALVAGAGAVAFMAVGALVPAVYTGFPLFIAAAVTLIAASRLIGNASRALALHGIKKDAGNNDFVPKLKQKAGNAMARAAKLNKYANTAFYVTIGAIVAPMLAPLAPVLLPIAAITYPIALAAMAGSWAGAEWNTGIAQGTKPTAKLVYDRQVAEGVIRPAEDLLPPAASIKSAPAAAAPQKSAKSIFAIFSRRTEKQPAPTAKPAPKGFAPSL